MIRNLYERVDLCVKTILAAVPNFQPRFGIILGSGLGSFADAVERQTVIPYSALPDFPTSSVLGHAGRLVLGHLGDVSIVAMQGRIHGYEGYAPEQVGFPTRVLCRLGIEHLTVTNAAGGINLGFATGELMAITDHMNLSGNNPLIGHNDERLGPRFPDMTHAYDRGALHLLRRTAAAEMITLQEGVYAGLSGPCFETPAEIRMLRALGADAVGMSTVPEVIVAAHMGVKVTGISCITNLAAGMTQNKLTHAEVGETTERVKDTFHLLLKRFLGNLAAAA
jgi:purine-nucleoside phosphorylase